MTGNRAVNADRLKLLERWRIGDKASGEPSASLPPVKTAEEGIPVLLLSVEQAARALGIGRSKAYELIAAGDLEAVHIGRATRVPVAALQDLLDRLPRVRRAS